MKKTFTFARIIVVTLIALAATTTRARAAVTVYAEDMASNAAVTASAPVTETNVPAAQTNLNAKSRSHGDNPQVRIDETGVHIGGPDGVVDIQTPRGTHGYAGGWRLLVSIVAIVCAFGMPVAIVAVAAYFHHRRTKLAHETMRMMIDKGMPITPELVAELRSKRPHGTGESPTRKSGLFPGLVLAGIGTALLVTGSGHSTGGYIVLFIGVAFLVTWLVERQHQSNTQPPKP